ncbi:hypothetical protein ALP17_112339 [Pseudomonas savastanoi]|uniref:Uncharacterized protein n=1 Tax=Pseudomonas savastanoi TaxID=29438 RepID=A0A3M5ZU79_PSESS|nr:hypothetical protein ALO93_103060 [Pseudomonas amygdali pv. sesami]RMT95585.1 hypothetical protein ALP38_102652 [Pseudomonas amygdali pv. sesami]RMU03970.1 hypothetical protein ALP37_102899 [Pseudomonas amygdali pv. sesami]RMV10611.1 hypothetical protein ALP17_112339 [Pseudomonas savastanoi]
MKAAQNIICPVEHGSLQARQIDVHFKLLDDINHCPAASIDRAFLCPKKRKEREALV